MTTTTGANAEYNLGDYVLIKGSSGETLPARIVLCRWKNQTYARQWRIDVPQYRISPTSAPQLTDYIRKYCCRVLKETRVKWVHVGDIVRRAPELQYPSAPSHGASQQNSSESPSRGSVHETVAAEKAELQNDATKTSEYTAETPGIPVRRAARVVRTMRTKGENRVESVIAEVDNAVSEVASKGPPGSFGGSESGPFRNAPQGLPSTNTFEKADDLSVSNPQGLRNAALDSHVPTVGTQRAVNVAFNELIAVVDAVLSADALIGDTVGSGSIGKAKPSFENEEEPSVNEQDRENQVSVDDVSARAGALHKSVVIDSKRGKAEGYTVTARNDEVASADDGNIQPGKGAVLQQEGENAVGMKDRGDNEEAVCDRSGKVEEHAVGPFSNNEEDRADGGDEGIAGLPELQAGAVGDTEKPAFTLGDIVFAQHGKYPHWPAIVGRCDWENGYWKWRQEDKGKFFVRFFGENNSAWVPGTNMKPFTPNGSNIRKKHLVRAIKSAKEYIEDCKAKRVKVEQGKMDDELESNEVDFKIDDFVMAQMWGYPFWPAAIKPCPWRKDEYKGKWKLTDPVRYWCSFPDASGNWVEARSVKRFDPEEVRTYATNIHANKTLQQDIETMAALFNERDGPGNVEKEQEEQEEQKSIRRYVRRRNEGGASNRKKIRKAHNDE